MTQTPPAPPESPWTKRIALAVVGGMLITFAAAIGLMAWVGLHLTDMRRAESARRDTAQGAASSYGWQLCSAKPFNEVRVPFTYQINNIHTSLDFLIFVKATFGDKTSPCVVDTGASHVGWPQSLHLKSKRLSGVSQPGNDKARGIDDSYRNTEAVILPRVRIGDYELTALPTSMIRSAAREPGIADTVPVIGDYAFLNIVLTIDYKNRTLILRNAAYDAFQSPRSKKDMQLDFEWVGGSPTIRGTLEGRPAKFLVDTGCGQAVAVSKRFQNTYLSKWRTTKRTSNGAFGRTQELCLDKVRYGIGDRRMCAEGIGVPDLPGEWDGIIGKPFLALYDVTIDYPRRKILLHRNSLPDTENGSR